MIDDNQTRYRLREYAILAASIKYIFFQGQEIISGLTPNQLQRYNDIKNNKELQPDAYSDSEIKKYSEPENILAQAAMLQNVDADQQYNALTELINNIALFTPHNIHDPTTAINYGRRVVYEADQLNKTQLSQAEKVESLEKSIAAILDELGALQKDYSGELEKRASQRASVTL